MAKTKAEFEEFAKARGHKPENGVVSFEQDEQAADAFFMEASKAGFYVVKDFSQGGSYYGADDLPKLTT